MKVHTGVYYISYARRLILLHLLFVDLEGTCLADRQIFSRKRAEKRQSW